MYKQIITISRTFGSGGREIGKRVADDLGIAFYDRELIQMAAEKSGFSLSYVEEAEESKANSLLYNIAMTGIYARNAYATEYLSPMDQVYVLQSRIIREIAEKGPCVIVGRSADYILKDRRDCLHAFIHADTPQRLERIVKTYGIPEKEAEKELQKKDKGRANHYRHYTGRIWGMAQNYHIALDSGTLGLAACAGVLAGLVRKS